MAGTTDFEVFYLKNGMKAGRGGAGFDDEDEEDSGFFLRTGADDGRAERQEHRGKGERVRTVRHRRQLRSGEFLKRNKNKSD